jgi:hypothetical protein
LTLWASIVAERLGFDHDEALTLGKAVAGLNAQAKAADWASSSGAKDGTVRLWDLPRLKESARWLAAKAD